MNVDELLNDLENDQWETSFAPPPQVNDTSTHHHHNEAEEDGIGQSEDLFASLELRMEMDTDKSKEDLKTDTESKKINRLSEEIRELLEENRRIETELEKENNLMKELGFVANLKNHSEGCRSEQKPLISASVSIQFLSSGRFLLIVDVKNDTNVSEIYAEGGHILEQWELLVQYFSTADGSFSPLSDNVEPDPSTHCGVNSISHPLRTLTPGTNVRLDIFCESVPKLPFIVKTCLSKMLPNVSSQKELLLGDPATAPLSGAHSNASRDTSAAAGCQPKKIQIRLRTDVISCWYLICPSQSAVFISESQLRLAKRLRNCDLLSTGSFKLSFSKSFVFLVCRGHYSCEKCIHWLLPWISEREILNCASRENRNQLDPQRRPGDDCLYENLTVSGFPSSKLKITLQKQSKPQSQILLTVEVSIDQSRSNQGAIPFSATDLAFRLKQGLYGRLLMVLHELRTCPKISELDLVVLEERVRNARHLQTKSLEDVAKYLNNVLLVDLPIA